MHTLIEHFLVIWPRSRLDADISICLLESRFPDQDDPGDYIRAERRISQLIARHRFFFWLIPEVPFEASRKRAAYPPRLTQCGSA
jgi:hypothetical protein